MRRPKRLPLDDLAPYRVGGSDRLEVSHFKSPIDFAAVFGTANPVELEVGFGKGAFLVDAATRHPATNWLGIEIDRGLELYVATRLAKRKLGNARVTCGDALMLLRDRIAAGALAAVHVYFPDPWWKKRHRKRRVWTPEFAAECVRVLRPGGRLHVATDVGDYYAVIRELLDAQAGLTLVAAHERTGEPAADELLTNFERKALQTGGRVWRAEYQKGER